MLCIIGDSHLFFIYTIYIPQYHYLVDPPELALVYAQLLSSMNHFIRFLFDFLYLCYRMVCILVQRDVEEWKKRNCCYSVIFMIQ